MILWRSSILHPFADHHFSILCRWRLHLYHRFWVGITLSGKKRETQYCITSSARCRVRLRNLSRSFLLLWLPHNPLKVSGKYLIYLSNCVQWQRTSVQMRNKTEVHWDWLSRWVTGREDSYWAQWWRHCLRDPIRIQPIACVINVSLKKFAVRESYCQKWV